MHHVFFASFDFGSILEVVRWVQAHALDIAAIVTSAIGTASLIVKLTPTQKDDNVLAAIIRFVSRFIALNTTKHENVSK